ncbi:MAG TPA: hypothetical protein VIE66_14560 [Methylocella sp.]|jgi:hypothetical protein
MSQRNEGRFKQREVTRTIKAIEAAGRVVDHVEITKDGARITIRQDGSEPKDPASADEIIKRLK